MLDMIPTIDEDFEQKMRFLDCGATYRTPCEFCGELYRSDVWHPCEKRNTYIMNKNESDYRAYRQKMGTRDNWTGD